MIVSGRQQRDSVIHIGISILFQIPLLSKLPHNIEQSSLCYIVHSCLLSILNIAMCSVCPKLPDYAFLHPSPYICIFNFLEKQSICTNDTHYITKKFLNILQFCYFFQVCKDVRIQLLFPYRKSY